MKYRIEFDSIGKIKVPGDKYWGASTERSRKYFNIDVDKELLFTPTINYGGGVDSSQRFNLDYNHMRS